MVPTEPFARNPGVKGSVSNAVPAFFTELSVVLIGSEYHVVYDKIPLLVLRGEGGGVARVGIIRVVAVVESIVISV